jgi:acyl-CoA synthetase (AMP-forming)/AMP-acid ligase II
VPVAAVELRPGAPRVTEAELIEHVRQHMPATNVPTQIRIVDALPRTQSLKPNLGLIRKNFAAEAKAAAG